MMAELMPDGRDASDYAFDQYDQAECDAFAAVMRRPRLAVVPELAAVAAVPAGIERRPARRAS